MPIPFTELKLHECIFTWVDPDDGHQETFAIERLLAWCQHTAQPLISVKTTISDAMDIVRLKGLEQHRYDRLTLEHCLEPVIWIHMKDDTHLLVDGNHRYVKLVLEFGRGLISSYMVEYDDAVQFRVEGLPPASEAYLKGGWSGIP